jgi:hypothetical protein
MRSFDEFMRGNKMIVVDFFLDMCYFINFVCGTLKQNLINKGIGGNLETILLTVPTNSMAI